MERVERKNLTENNVQAVIELISLQYSGQSLPSACCLFHLGLSFPSVQCLNINIP